MQFRRCYGCMQELSAPGAVCPHCGYDNTAGPGGQPDHALRCGTVLSKRYVVGQMLGSGGFGITYIGYDLSLMQAVCIKEYYPAGAMRSAARSSTVYWYANSVSGEKLRRGRESLVKEARKGVRLQDLGSIVKVWDVFYENDTAYIIMGYVEGQTLKQYLFKTQMLLSEKACFTLLAPVIRDLGEAHARGIIHRDISPDNLMLQPNGSLILLDMGAAKDLSGGSEQSALVVAKRGFSPPEQYTVNSSIGPWTDIYTMCACIYYCITGRILPEPIARMCGSEINWHGVSPQMQAVLEKGLALRAEDRFQSMHKLLDALTQAVQEPPAPEPEPKPKPEPKPRPRTRLPEILAGLLAAALLLFGGNLLLGKPAPYEERTPSPAPTEAAEPVQTSVPTPVPAAMPTLTPRPKLSPAPTPTPTLAPTATPAPTRTPAPVLLPDSMPLSFETADSDFVFSVYDDQAEITNYTGNAASIAIPQEIEGRPVTAIGTRAFEKCASLKSITIPDSVVRIGDNAFWGCFSLESITIPSGVTEIGRNPVSSCSRMANIRVAEGNTHFVSVNGVLYTMDMQTLIAYPEGLTETRFTIQDGVKTIGAHAFNCCFYLEDITIPDSVTSLEEMAFANCKGMTGITLPDSVASISYSAFIGCDELKSIRVAEGNEHYVSVDGVLYTKDLRTIIRYPAARSDTSYAILPGVTGIWGCAFEHSSALEEITLPNSLTEIGHSAFWGCDSIANVFIPDSVTSIKGQAFEGCIAMRRVQIPKSVTSIEENAFTNCPSATIYVEVGSYAARFFADDPRTVIFDTYVAAVTTAPDSRPADPASDDPAWWSPTD